jgi:hypothetical protein
MCVYRGSLRDPIHPVVGQMNIAAVVAAMIPAADLMRVADEVVGEDAQLAAV